MRYLFSGFLLLPLFLLSASPNWAQDTDRARHAKRIAELQARLDKLPAEPDKLKAAAKPVFKDEYMTSADAKTLQGKWQAVRIVFGEGMIYPPTIAAEDIGKLQLEITEHWYYPSRGPVKWLEPGKKPVEREMPDMDGTWRIDPTTAPKSIVIYPTPDDLLERIPIRGIYKLEGDTLTICFGSFGKPPIGFDDKNAFVVAVYKRIQMDSKKPVK
jgi:uncharacterized protein (TIGR03067 family)